MKRECPAKFAGIFYDFPRPGIFRISSSVSVLVHRDNARTHARNNVVVARMTPMTSSLVERDRPRKRVAFNDPPVVNIHDDPRIEVDAYRSRSARETPAILSIAAIIQNSHVRCETSRSRVLAVDDSPRCRSMN